MHGFRSDGGGIRQVLGFNLGWDIDYTDWGFL
jgi:hypothetical protein